MVPRAAVVLLVLSPLAARGDDHNERKVDFPVGIDIAELVIPDTRWEWKGAFHGSRLVLSWPAPIALPRLHLHDRVKGADLLPLLVVEPQLAFGGRTDWRAVGSARAIFVRGKALLSGLVEAVGVYGRDGHGGGFGVGIGLGGRLSLVYRMLFIGSEGGGTGRRGPARAREPSPRIGKHRNAPLGARAESAERLHCRPILVPPPAWAIGPRHVVSGRPAVNRGVKGMARPGRHPSA